MSLRNYMLKIATVQIDFSSQALNTLLFRASLRLIRHRAQLGSLPVSSQLILRSGCRFYPFLRKSYVITANILAVDSIDVGQNIFSCYLSVTSSAHFSPHMNPNFHAFCT